MWYYLWTAPTTQIKYQITTVFFSISLSFLFLCVVFDDDNERWRQKFPLFLHRKIHSELKYKIKYKIKILGGAHTRTYFRERSFIKDKRVNSQKFRIFVLFYFPIMQKYFEKTFVVCLLLLLLLHMWITFSLQRKNNEIFVRQCCQGNELNLCKFIIDFFKKFKIFHFIELARNILIQKVTQNLTYRWVDQIVRTQVKAHITAIWARVFSTIYFCNKVLAIIIN